MKIFWFVLLTFQLFGLSAIAQKTEGDVLRKAMHLTKDSLHYIDLYNQLGFQLHLRNPDSTLLYGIQSEQLSRRLHYQKGLSGAYSNIAAALMLKGLYNQALKYYGKSYAISRDLGDNAGMMQGLVNDAIAFDFIGDSLKRLYYVQKSLRIAEMMPSDSVTSMIYVNYVALNPALSKDSAKFYLNKARAIAKAFRDERVMLAIDQQEADSYIGGKDYPAARKDINRVLAVARHNQWDYHELEGLSLLAQYYRALNRIDSAVFAYEKIYRTAVRDKFSFWETEVLTDLIQCAKLQNDIPGQLHYHELLSKALTQRNEQMTAFIGDYLDYALAQDNIKKLELENSNSTWRIRWLVGLAVGGIMIAFLLFILYRRSRSLTRVLSSNDNFKNQLISILAHDFRAPIGSTLGLITLLRDGDLEKEEALPLFATLDEDLRNVLLTFDNLLTWIKLQQDGYAHHPQSVYLSSLWEDNLQFFNHLIQEKEIVVSLDIPAGLHIETDKEMLQFVNRNLLHNAIKYSPKGGNISIAVSSESQSLLTQVKDQGPGMSPEKLQMLFSFNKDQGGTRNGGAGMAMTISKELLGKLGGKIWAESSSDKGTAFYFSLPLN